MANFHKNNLKKIASGRYELDVLSEAGPIHIQLGKIKEHRWHWKLNYLNQYLSGAEPTYWQSIEAIGSASRSIVNNANRIFVDVFVG
jgi:hypothetical protein